MSGPIEDMPLYVCRVCGTVHMGDEHMYEEPERCPKCGAYPDDGRPSDKNEEDSNEFC